MAISNLAHDTAQYTRSQVSRASSLARIAANITQARALYRDDQEPTEHLSPQTLIDCDARPVVSLAPALSVSLSPSTVLSHSQWHARDKSVNFYS